MADTTNDKVYWVRGNTQPLIIPLEKEVMTPQEEIVPEPYYPDGEAVITVNFAGKWRKYSYTPQLDGNLLIFTDNATLPAGSYDVEILIDNPDGTHERSQWDNQVVVTDSNPSVLQEWDEFKEQDIKARAALFFFAKGDKGDPFTYQDFTPEQIDDLKRPATEAAADVAALEQRIEAAEALREQSEGTRQQNEQTRQNQEAQREQDMGAIKTDYALVKQDAQTATDNANNKAAYAKEQGDYAKEKADEIEEAKGSYPTLDARLDAMDVDTESRLDKITEEQFDEIFN